MLHSTVKHMSQRNENPRLEAFFETKVSLKQFEQCKAMLREEMSELRARIEALESIVEPDLSSYDPVADEEEDENDQEDENEEEYSSSGSESSTSDSGDSESDYENSPRWYRPADDDDI